MGRRVLGVVVVVWSLFAREGAAQTRPLQTEEATTSPARTIWVEAGGRGMHDDPNFKTNELRDTWAAPLLRVVWSPAERVELDLEWVGFVGQVKDPTYGTTSDYGDVTLRAKTRLHGWDGGPTVSARFGVTLPETKSTQGLGPNSLRALAQVMASQTWGATRVHGNAGFLIHDDPLRPNDQRDFLAYGVAVEHAAQSWLSLVGEVAGQAGNGTTGAEEHSEARLGFRMGRGRVVADAAVRRGLLDTDGAWGWTAGLRVRVQGPN